MLDLLTSTAFDLAGQPVSWAEPLGFLTGLVTVALAVPQRVETFPVGIANNVFFLVLFWDARLYADAGLQVVFALLSAMGWWAWLAARPAPRSAGRLGRHSGPAPGHGRRHRGGHPDPDARAAGGPAERLAAACSGIAEVLGT